MSFWISFGIFLVIGLAILMAVLVFIIRFSKDETMYEDRPFVLNFLSAHSFPKTGVAYGVEKAVSNGKGERKICTVEQRDVLPKNFEKITDVKVVVDKNKIISIPKGSWSQEKNINIYLPSSATDFPDSLKDTEFGKSLMLLTEIKNAVNSEINMVKEGSLRKDEILKRLGDGELSREHLMTVDEILKDIIKLAAETKKEVKPSPYSPVTHQGQPGGF